jgi:hypothetical protein
MTQFSNFDKVMEAENHVKHGASSKSLMSRRNLLRKKPKMKRLVFSFILAVAMYSIAFGQEKRYGFESGILKTNTVMKRQNMTEQSYPSTLYFSDYGRKMSTETSLNTNFTLFIIMKDGYMYQANMNRRQGTKINIADADITDVSSINFLDLTDEVKKKFQIEELDNEQFLGKDCKRYDLTYTNQGHDVKTSVWIWQGLTLKSISNMVGVVSALSEVTEILEDAEIAKEKFELPEGINFIEVNSQQPQLQDHNSRFKHDTM